MSSFVLKIIAALSMLIDHTGLILFPQYKILRIIGRLAFPIYAYCIAEGFRYTRSRLKYFLKIFLLGVFCQIVYSFADDELYIGILLVFSMSLVIMIFTDGVKCAMRGQKSAAAVLYGKITKKSLTCEQDKTLSLVLSCASVTAAFVLCMYVEVDYGFFGIMLPVFTSFFDNKQQKMVMFSAALLAVCIDVTSYFSLQYFSLLTIPLIALYNGERGKYRLKYFFYVFYPVHLGVLYLLSYFLH